MSHTARKPDFPPDGEQDLLLDALLDEMLGGVSPPDVTSRVLSAIRTGNGLANGQAAANGHAANGHGLPRAIPLGVQAEAPIPLPTGTSPGSSSGAYLARRRRGKLLEWSIAGGVIAGCAMAVWLTFVSDLFRGSDNHHAPVAAPQQPKPGTGKDGHKSPIIAEKGVRQPADVPQNHIAQPTPRDHEVTPRAPEPHSPESRAVADSPVPDAPSNGSNSPVKQPSETPVRPTVRSSDAEVIASIDQAIRRRWASATITPSARATDAEWLRRVFLAVLGRIPKLDEVETFLADRSTNKREAAIDRLLVSEVYADEFARNWTNVYTEALLGHTAGDLPTDKTNRAGLQQYLRRSFLENKPYDVLTSELLTATGSTQPGAADYNGATNFLVDKLDASGVQATVKTAQIFLGVQVQCTQCHNHPFNEWKQGRFWELNAFFRQAKSIGDVAAAANGSMAPARVADQDFHGEGDQADDDAEVYYEERSGRLKVAYPVFFDGTAIARNGDVSQVNRRHELAKLVTASPWFADAAVNRVWSHFFGHGFTKPVDDMGPHNPPTHPEVLDRLSREFAGRNYDLKALIRWIALSEAYALSSKPSRDNLHDDPTDGDPPLFSRYYLRQIRAEQLYESLAATTGEMQPKAPSRGDGDVFDEAYADREQEKAAWMRQFVLAYRTDECDECSLFVGSIPQTLSMMNGEMTADATSAKSAGVLAQIAAAPVSDAKKVQQLFLAALARNPSPGEQTAARKLIASHGNDTAAGLEDLWWALLNSNEFILDR